MKQPNRVRMVLAVLTSATCLAIIPAPRAEGGSCTNTKCYNPELCEYGVGNNCYLTPIKCSVEYCT
jgi:hypothetical protein